MIINISVDTMNPEDVTKAPAILTHLAAALSGHPAGSAPAPEKLAPVTKLQTPAPEEMAEEEAEKPKRASRAKAKPAPEPTPEPEPEESEEAEAPEEEDDTPMALAADDAGGDVTAEMLQDCGRKLLTETPNGRAKLKAVLAEFGVAKVTNLEEDQYAEAYAKLTEAANSK